MPHYHVVEFGNRLPSRKCKAVALMPQQAQARYYPYNDGRNCGGEMPADLPALEPMDPMEDIPKPKGVFQPEKRGTVPFTVQHDDIMYLHRPTDEHCLLRDGNLYPLTTFLRGPLALPSKECVETNHTTLQPNQLAWQPKQSTHDWSCHGYFAHLPTVPTGLVASDRSRT